MTRSSALPAPGALLSTWPLTVAVAAVAAITGTAIAAVLLPMSARDVLLLLAYMLGSGGGFTLLAALALRGLERRREVSLQRRVQIGALIGTGASLLMVVSVSGRMFVNTAHDLRLLIALLVASGGISFAFVSWTSALLVRRLHLLQQAVRQLAAEDATTVGEDDRDEVAELERAVGQLAARLAASERQREAIEEDRRALTAAVSHDLRTPLGSIRAMAEALDDGVVADTETAQSYYRSIRQQVDRLSRMVDDLFDLSRMDAGVLEATRQPVTVEEVAFEVAESLRIVADRAGVSIACHGDLAAPPLMIDADRVARAITNLVRNAIEHADPGSQVTVTVTREPSRVTTIVHNYGPVIPAGDLDRVWERFFRGATARSRPERGDGDGAGLGLAIVRAVAELHGGTVAGASDEREGTTFSLTLPV